MDGFLFRRVADARFKNERRVTVGGGSGGGGSGGGTWYLASARPTHVTHHTFSDYKSGDSNHKMTPHKGDDDGPKKKKKKAKGEFSESKKEALTNRTSSDDSDGGPCWSDYERVPGTKAGAKGSCRPKGGKKKE